MNEISESQIRLNLEEHFRTIYDLQNNQEMINYMKSSKTSERFFFNMTIDMLLVEYLKRVNEISNIFGESIFTKKEKVLNYLEYIRLCGMYENIRETEKTKMNDIASISQFGFNIGLFGKGVCASQACFLRDLLITGGLSAHEYGVFIFEENEVVLEGMHLVTLIQENDECFFLDPTWYNGTIKSLKGSMDYSDIREKLNNKVKKLFITQDDINKARNTVLNYLIKKFKIREISKQLNLDGKNDLEKQMRILAFMEKNLIPATEFLTCRSIEIGNYEIEVGKVLEMFYQANNIKYRIFCNKDKSNSKYITIIDGQECILEPIKAFSCSKNTKVLTPKMHYIRYPNGEKKYLWELNSQIKEQIIKYIEEGRNIAKQIDLSLHTSEKSNYES